jgi:phosphatidylinositol glycan class S
MRTQARGVMSEAGISKPQFAVGHIFTDLQATLTSEEHITPHLEPLSDVFNFTIESQILYHAPLSFEPTYGPVPPKDDVLPADLEKSQSGDAVDIVKDELSGNVDEAWQVGEEEMKVFVNSEKWSLGKLILTR